MFIVTQSHYFDNVLRLIRSLLSACLTISDSDLQQRICEIENSLVSSYDFLVGNLVHSHSLLCPDCQSHLRIHSSFARIVSFGPFSITFKGVRVRCSHCGKTHRILPEIITPRFNISSLQADRLISAAAQEQNISSAARDCSADPQTAQCFIRSLKRSFHPVFSSLRSLRDIFRFFSVRQGNFMKSKSCFCSFPLFLIL